MNARSICLVLLFLVCRVTSVTIVLRNALVGKDDIM